MRYLLLATFLLGFFAFSFDFGRFSQKFMESLSSTPIEKIPDVELIVVLTGGQGRLSSAFSLFQSGKGERLFVSGIDPEITLDDIFLANNIDSKNFKNRNRVILGRHSRNTPENAEEISTIIKRFKPKSLLFITSNYHIYRARELLLRRLEEKEEIPVPQIYFWSVESPNFEAETWWRSLTSWRILFSEYLKMRFQ